MRLPQVSTLRQGLLAFLACMLGALAVGGVSVALGAGNNAFQIAILVGVLGVVITYLVLGPRDFNLRCIVMAIFGGVEIALGVILHFATVFKVPCAIIALEGAVVFLVCLFLGGGLSGDNDISSGEGSGPGY